MPVLPSKLQYITHLPRYRNPDILYIDSCSTQVIELPATNHTSGPPQTVDTTSAANHFSEIKNLRPDMTTRSHDHPAGIPASPSTRTSASAARIPVGDSLLEISSVITLMSLSKKKHDPTGAVEWEMGASWAARLATNEQKTSATATK